MDETFSQVQDSIQRLLPLVLLGPGILFVVAGLMMWLGGLRWLKAIAAFTSAMLGLAVAMLFMGGQIIPLVLCPVILAGIGMFLNRFVVVFLGAVIVACAVMIIPSLDKVNWQRPTEAQAAAGNGERLDLLESIDEIEQFIQRTKETVKEVIRDIPASRKSTALIAAMAFAGVGFLSWRLVCALTCSTIGTAEIFMGMTVLLLFKGAAALQQLADNGFLLAVIAVGMIGLGTALQIWLCPAKRRKKDLAKELLSEEKKK